jgi:hypothetical protein
MRKNNPMRVHKMGGGGHLMDNEALVRQLPAFFRTLRGQKPTEEELRKIVHKIKEG